MAPDTHHPDVAAYAATLAPRQLELARRLATPVTADTVSVDAEMLAALRGLLRVMPVLPADARQIQGMQERYDEAIAEARAIIKRVEGKR